MLECFCDHMVNHMVHHMSCIGTQKWPDLGDLE